MNEMAIIFYFILLASTQLFLLCQCGCVTYRDEEGTRATTYCSQDDDFTVADQIPSAAQIPRPSLFSTAPTTHFGDIAENVNFFKWNKNTNNIQRIVHSSQVNGENLIILIHGFTSSAEAWRQSPHRNLIGALLYVSPNSDILLIDWSVEASPYGGDWLRFWELGNVYGKPAQNVKAVGAIVAKFLENSGGRSRINLSSAHCIGFSLGAHVCGFAGKYLTKGRLGRISGLDPAGPGFDSPYAMDRLDESDAVFVDVIHTSSQLGLLRAIGHVDFYVNDPTKQHPTCVKTGNLSPVIQLRRRRRRQVGKIIDGWKHVFSHFIRGVDFSHNDDVVSYFTGSPYGLENFDKGGVGQVVLDSITRHASNTINAANANICGHSLAIELYTQSCMPSCRMEYCACLSYISTQHEAFFQQQLETNCTQAFCNKWQNNFLFGYWARPAPKESQRYLHGNEECPPWPTTNNNVDDLNVVNELFQTNQ